MATLVLTAVGTALGGPLGGAVGALLGQAVDRSVIGAGPTRQGSRLSELRVQTSSYGDPIQHLFGKMRVAGTVIWSTDLIETRSVSSAGKGQPSVANYSYAASFAVLLSARPILSVRRIWADGNLLRGAAGDMKVSTGFRLHLGGEDQEADPLIASALGAGLVPAHRGCAYAVFENLALADFGNRIPSLSFEVVADAGPVPVGAIAAAVADEVDGDAAAMPLSGFAAGGSSTRETLDTLATASGAWFGPTGSRLVMREQHEADATIDDAGVRASAQGARRTRQLAAIETVPRLVSVSHYDPARDYQAGLQQARRPGAGSREQQVAMPAAIGAASAKEMATAILARAEAARTTRTVAASWAALQLAPGDLVSIKGEAGLWRVRQVLVEAMVVKLTLQPLPGPTLAGAADSGRPLLSADVPAGRTLLAAFEVPPLDDAVLSAPRITVAACGEGAGWRRAALLLSLDGGTSWAAAGGTALPATMGTVLTAPPFVPSTLLDMRSSFTVRLARPDMMLADADDGRLDAGANLALAGGELLQFGRAEPLGGGVWRLTRLLRGRRGSEGAAGQQQPGDPFVLLDPETLRTIDLPASVLGSEVRVLATGVGDMDGPVSASVAVGGASVLPPSPVHLVCTVGSEGDADVRWTRRSRAGWRWLDGGDTPLVEEAERYRIAVTPAEGVARIIELAATDFTLSPADRGTGSVEVEVRQAGTFGISAPAGYTIRGEGE